MDKDAMITYLIGELKKENLELHDLIIPEELEEKQKLLSLFCGSVHIFRVRDCRTSSVM